MPAPGAVVLRTDVERKSMFGKDEHDRLPAEAYTPAVTARVYAAIADKARRALTAGHSVDRRRGIRQAAGAIADGETAAAIGVPLQGLFLQTALDTRIARVGARARDASDADAAVARSQESYDLGDLGWARSTPPARRRKRCSKPGFYYGCSFRRNRTERLPSGV